MALQKGQRLREAGQFEVAAVGQIKSAGDRAATTRADGRVGRPSVREESALEDRRQRIAARLHGQWRRIPCMH
ncbi:hypothetical protein XANMN_12610 [Xanthomonas phaseoli pv. manihotis str. CIO151]|nr:hypothetical protein XANMN_12610 [Xanthomonas phaseoli pv. manihotis str. CIO151]